jgi:hypothetical protein
MFCAKSAELMTLKNSSFPNVQKAQKSAQMFEIKRLRPWGRMTKSLRKQLAKRGIASGLGTKKAPARLRRQERIHSCSWTPGGIGNKI